MSEAGRHTNVHSHPLNLTVVWYVWCQYTAAQIHEETERAHSVAFQMAMMSNEWCCVIAVPMLLIR